MGQAQPIRILVIDDEASLLGLLAMHFTMAGFVCDAVSSSQQALDNLGAKIYDVVLTDLNLPQIDGITLVRKIRTELKQKVPIVVLTGFLADKAELFDVGVQGVLAKPVRAKTLIESAQECIIPVEQRLAKIPQVSDNITVIKITLESKDRGKLWQLGGQGLFLQQKLLQNFDFLEKDTFVKLEVTAPEISTAPLSGIGYIQWVRSGNDKLPAGIGLEIKYLDKQSRTNFCKTVESLTGVATIPVGKKTA